MQWPLLAQSPCSLPTVYPGIQAQHACINFYPFKKYDFFKNLGITNLYYNLGQESLLTALEIPGLLLHYAQNHICQPQTRATGSEPEVVPRNQDDQKDFSQETPSQDDQKDFS